MKNVLELAVEFPFVDLHLQALSIHQEEWKRPHLHLKTAMNHDFILFTVIYKEAI